MATRRPHKKSRLGCQTCKRRKVKCDESHPRCGPCVLRDIECKYLSPTNQPEAEKVACSPPNEWHSNSTLELELMHQWTSTTYKSYCASMTEEYDNWQILIPQLALQHDFLLHALFAMSALEIVALSSRDDEAADGKYMHAVLEYQSRVSRRLRDEIATSDFATMPLEKHRALWATASILMVLALAGPRYSSVDDDGDEDVLTHMLTYHELIKGFVLVVFSRMASTVDDPLLSNYKQWDELEMRKLEADEMQALERLKELNEQNFGSARSNRFVLSELEAADYHAVYRKAIFFLEKTFEKCMYPKTRGYGLGWLFQCGPGFVAAVKAREPFALLLLAHWALWMEKSSYGIWYALETGQRLVDEVSETIEAKGGVTYGAALRWVREQVGLEGEALDV